MQISIRTGLSVGIIAIVVVTAALVHVPWQITSRGNVDELDDRINGLVVESIGSKIDALLDEAVAARAALGVNIESGATALDDRDRLEALFMALLQSQPNLTAIEFGSEDDRSLLVRRADSGSIRIEETVPVDDDTATRTVRVYRAGSNGQFAMAAGTTKSAAYFATQQFWYKNAFTQDTPVWSNIFRLPTSGVFGVTNAATVERNGEVQGVLGVSISLDTLSAFLDGVTVGRKGSVFLTNIYGQLVATQRSMPGAMADPNAPVMLPRIGKSITPAVHVVAAAVQAEGLDLKALREPHQIDYRDPKTGESFFVTLAPLTQMGLIVAVELPAAEVLGPIERNTRLLLIGLAVFVLAMLAVGTYAARRLVAAPLGKVTANLRQLEDFRFDRIGAVPSMFCEIRDVSGATARMAASLSSFKKYIPTELVRSLFAQGIEAKLGGEMRDLSIFFMDLAGFTQISERLGDRLIEFLGDYLSEMSAAVQSEDGTIDKYIGDAIMAFWGAPVPAEDHALRACRAALACQARLAELRRAGADTVSELMRARIGINTGRVLVGNVGSHDRINYSVIGDPVNIASRLEALNKVYGTEIMLGQGTVEEAGAHLVVRKLDRVAVYGREGGLEIYELLGLRISPDELGTALGKPLRARSQCAPAKRLGRSDCHLRKMRRPARWNRWAVGAPDRKSQRVQGDPAAIGLGWAGRYGQ